MTGVRCISCRYDLSGQTGEFRPGVRCPECGEVDAARPVPENVGGVTSRMALGFALLLAAAWVAFDSRLTKERVVVMAVLTGASFASLLRAVRRARGWEAGLPAALLGLVSAWIVLWIVGGLSGAF